MSFLKRISLGLVVFALPFFLSSHANGQTLYEMLERVVVEHDLVQAAEAGKDAAEQNVRRAVGEWYPHVNATVEAGREAIDPPGDRRSTTYNRNYQKIRASQLIHDFGRTGSGIDRAKIELDRSEAEIRATRQNLILQGIAAYLDVYRQVERLRLARESEQRIVDLTGIEETLVTRGAGLASDVLHAKSQLAGAKALSVRAEGRFKNAINRFRTVFGFELTDQQISQMQVPYRSLDNIPLTIDEALVLAGENSIDLYLAARDIEVARQEIRLRESRYYPRLHLVGEAKRRENDIGVRGLRTEALAMVELNWELFSGGKDMAAVSQARHSLTEMEKKKNDLEQLVQERVMSAWQSLITSKENSRYLWDQVSILEEFLELAQRERRLGTRSLLDVLNGEVTHLNALSNAISADIDQELAMYNMLYAMGRLELDVLR